MMRLKVVATFFQNAELTTMIRILWPAIMYFTLPFQFPSSDVGCLVSGSGWTHVNTFYTYIFGPTFVLSLHIINTIWEPEGFYER